MWKVISKSQLIEIIDDCLNLPDETDWVEFKSNFFEYQSLWERICGISNSACLNWKEFGFLIYWVEDSTLNLIWTKFTPESEKVWSAPFEFKLSQDIQPDNIDISINTIDYKNTRLVVFIIPSAIDQPTTFKKKSYIRVWSATTELYKYPDKEQKIWKNTYNKNYEKQIAISWLHEEEVFEYLDIDIFFNLLWVRKPDNSEEICKHLIHDKVIQKSLSRYDITNLGALLFARNLLSFDSVKRKWVRVVVYDWDDKTADNKSYDGNKWYALWFEELLKYINLLIPSFEKIVDWRRVSKNNYPNIALRELIANALIHQDLSINGTTPIIEIYKNRVEITNPWKPLIEITRFIDFQPQSRNEDLASMMRRMKFCEELWSWVDKVVMSIEKEKLPPPKFEVNDDFTRVTMYSWEDITSLSKEDRVRACFQHCVIKYILKDYMTNTSFRDRMNLEQKQYTVASWIISQTIDAWYIKVLDPENKANRHTKYVPIWHS